MSQKVSGLYFQTLMNAGIVNSNSFVSTKLPINHLSLHTEIQYKQRFNCFILYRRSSNFHAVSILQNCGIAFAVSYSTEACNILTRANPFPVPY